MCIRDSFRTVMSEMVARQLGNPHPEHLFPGFRNPGSLKLLG